MEKVCEVGVVIVGGYFIYDDEFKYGLVVIGMVVEDKIFINGGV